jgi:hypothetical protein
MPRVREGKLMTKTYYIAERDGNGAIRTLVEDVTTGPYYDEEIWITKYGYETLEGATEALSNYFTNCEYTSGEFFIIAGYSK